MSEIQNISRLSEDHSSGIDCHCNGVCNTPVFYTDDMCIMALCAIALQELIKDDRLDS